jgi:membrane protein involved in colicin uptake
LANATSSPPKRATASATASRTASDDVTSTCAPTHAAPKSGTGSTSHATTDAPSDRNNRTVSAPIDPAAPVISATFPASLSMAPDRTRENFRRFPLDSRR